MELFPQGMDADAIGRAIAWLAVTLFLVVAQLVLRRIAAKKQDILWIRSVSATLRPFFFIVCVLLARSALQLLPSEPVKALGSQATNILLVITAAWWLLAAARAVKERTLRRFDVTVADNLHARQVHTRIAVLYRIFSFFVVLLAIAFGLMTFEAVRAVGTSLLAGAGVTGIILGFAAQKTIGSVFAGIQIAITQPIKIDDAVVIEGEWGWIEEITLTYVVVRIWDLRRLIVPITYFVETPIQNWTRHEAEIIGTVFINVDYTVEIDPLREELQRLAEASPLWNGRVCVLQVVEATERTMQLRALVTAGNSPDAWDLRCYVREGLLTYLQKHQLHALPKARLEMQANAEAMEGESAVAGQA